MVKRGGIPTTILIFIKLISIINNAKNIPISTEIVEALKTIS